MDKIFSNGKPFYGWGNRGWLEINYTILQVCESISLKTNIMNKCNLNSVQVEKYLEFLLDSKLLETKKKSTGSKKHAYKTTEEGENFLQAYQSLVGILNRASLKKQNMI